MLSSFDYHKSLSFEHKFTVMLTDEHSKYFSYAQMFNFSDSGLYFRLDAAYKWDSTIQIDSDSPAI